MKKRKAKPEADITSDLLELAQSKSLVDGFLDDEIWDCCYEIMQAEHKKICGAVLLDQIEFLRLHGYSEGRIRELIEGADMAG